ncbi:tannase and feruloyl esterase [Thozetella sp. PMI_491]|nr:tannase and feruloyl esterase [Thozetella sp. PMI_491]
MYNLPVGAANYIPPSLFPALAAEVIKQCDEVDHVKDGIVSTLDVCQFDFSKIRCGNAGVNASACLTDKQIQTAKNIYSDDYAANGTLLANSYSLSSEMQWTVEIGGTEPSPFGVGYQRFFVLNDPNWDWHNYNDSLIDLAVRTDPGESTADKYDISAFKNRGGKVFMYHGIADAVVPPRGSLLYYNRTIDTFGGLDPTKEFFRMFLIPGMQHCWTTVVDAPWHIAGAFQSGFLGTDVWSVPGFKDKNHDSLMALMDWVEQGNAVDSIIATTWRNPGNASSGVLRQRPLCPWPQTAVYNNVGNVNSASSWSCQ